MLRKLCNPGVESGAVVAGRIRIAVTAGAGFPLGLYALQQGGIGERKWVADKGCAPRHGVVQRRPCDGLLPRWRTCRGV